MVCYQYLDQVLMVVDTIRNLTFYNERRKMCFWNPHCDHGTTSLEHISRLFENIRSVSHEQKY